MLVIFLLSVLMYIPVLITKCVFYSRRSSFSGRVPTIQESDESHGGRRNSTEFDVIDDDVVDEALDVVNQNVSAFTNGLSGEESSVVGNDSDNNTPTRVRHRHRHHHHHCHQRDSADSEKNNGGDQLSSDNREDTTPDRLVGTPDSDGPKFRSRDMSFDKSFDSLIERLNSDSQGSLNKSETKSTASNGGGSDRETASKVSSDDIVVTVTKPSKVEKKRKSSALFTVSVSPCLVLWCVWQSCLLVRVSAPRQMYPCCNKVVLYMYLQSDTRKWSAT